MTLEETFQQFVQWMLNLSIQYHYFGVFLVSLIGSMSLFIPIPYTAFLFTLGSMETFNPILLAIASSLGSAVGEFSGYLLGLGGRKIISEKNKRKMNAFIKVFGKYGYLGIFIFALTPLPDDLVFIPLGIMRYSFLKTFIPAFIGKLCMSLIIVYSARFTLQIIRQIFGVEGNLISAIIGMIIALILLALIFIIMFKVDWEKMIEKHVTEKEGRTEENASNS